MIDDNLNDNSRNEEQDEFLNKEKNDSSFNKQLNKNPMNTRNQSKNTKPNGSPLKNNFNKTTSALKDKLKDNPVNQMKDDVKENIDKIQKTTKGISLFLNGLVSLLINPITWVCILVGVLCVVAVSGTQILGQSDFAKNCDSSGNTTMAAELSKDEKERGQQVGSWLVSNKFAFLGDKPMTKEQAAGMIGNMTRESHVSSTMVQTVSLSNPDYYKSCDNECVLSWGDVGGKAIGLIQWDSGRRITLVNYAKSKGKQWYDAEVQLNFLKDEADSTEKPSYSKAFAKCATVEECVIDFCRDVERAGHPAEGERIAAGQEFAKSFSGSTGGSGFDSGSVSTCSGDSSGMDMSGVSELAISIAYPWPEYQKSYVSNGDSYGKNNVTPGYKEAKALAEKNGGADPMPGLYASCDRFVATVLKATKADVDVPWGSTTEQYAYFKSSPKWKQVSCQDRKPGDVIITTTNGHVMLYVGNVKGVDSLSSASYTQRVGATGPLQGCVGDAFNADTYTNTVGFRLK